MEGREKSAPNYRVLIAASGTGGHLFPALHIANALRVAAPQIDLLFVGSGRPLEAKVIDANGIKRVAIDIVGVKNRGIKGLIQFGLRLPRAVYATWKILSQFKPQVIVGVGGYASVLPVILGRLRGCQTWIHECELRPGLANWVLAPFAKRISVSFERAKMPCRKKVIYTGMPVRPGLSELRSKSTNALEKPTHILAVGGSQGAHALDLALAELAPWLKERGLEIWQQCRKENVIIVQQAYAAVALQANVVAFIDDPVSAYDWAHLIVSRSGASSVMEIGVINKPAILVPYPHAQGNHQVKNALTLVDSGKALMVEEGPEFKLRIKSALETLLDPPTYRALLDRPHVERSTNAAQLIAEEILKLAR